jgi:hypothetical protein
MNCSGQTKTSRAILFGFEAREIAFYLFACPFLFKPPKEVGKGVAQVIQRLPQCTLRHIVHPRKFGCFQRIQFTVQVDATWWLLLPSSKPSTSLPSTEILRRCTYVSFSCLLFSFIGYQIFSLEKYSVFCKNSKAKPFSWRLVVYAPFFSIH